MSSPPGPFPPPDPTPRTAPPPPPAPAAPPDPPDPPDAGAVVTEADVSQPRPARPEHRTAVVPATVFVGVLLAIALVLAVVVAFDIGDDDGDGGDDRRSDATTLVRFDDGGLEVLDESATVVRRIAADDRPPLPLGDGRAVSAETGEDGRLRVYDLATGDVTQIDTGVEGRVEPVGADVAVVASSVGGPAAVVDLRAGSATTFAELVDMGDAEDEPLVLPPYLNPERDVAVLTATADGETRSLVVPADGTPWSAVGFVPDVSGTTAIAVSQARDAARVRLARAGEPVSGEVDLGDARLVGGAVLRDGSALLVARDGAVSRLVEDGSELEQLTSLDVGDVRSGRRVHEDRILVVGERATVLLDAAGEILRRWDAIGEDEIVPGRLGTSCAVIQPGAAPVLDGDGVTLIDLRTGDTLLELTSSPAWSSPDGCSLVTISRPQVVVVDGEVVEVPAANGERRDVIALDPASERVVVSRPTGDGDGRTSVLVDLDTGDETDVGIGFYAFYP